MTIMIIMQFGQFVPQCCTSRPLQLNADKTWVICSKLSASLNQLKLQDWLQLQQQMLHRIVASVDCVACVDYVACVITWKRHDHPYCIGRNNVETGLLQLGAGRSSTVNNPAAAKSPERCCTARPAVTSRPRHDHVTPYLLDVHGCKFSQELSTNCAPLWWSTSLQRSVSNNSHITSTASYTLNYRPVDPSSPWAPVCPGAPACPVGPPGPCGPMAPGSPGPPVSPELPVDPVTPVAPVAPCGPGNPVAPSGPEAPVSPANNHRQH